MNSCPSMATAGRWSSRPTGARTRPIRSGALALVMLALMAVSTTLSAQTTDRLTFKNNCSFPIWLERENNSGVTVIPVLPNKPPLDPSVKNILPLGIGEGPLAVGIHDIGWAGRFFPKLDCDPQTGADCKAGQANPPCPVIGGCQPPATTKIEFNFADLAGSRDSWYDIGFVDGYNLTAEITPRGVTPSGSCTTTTCNLSLSVRPETLWVGRIG